MPPAWVLGCREATAQGYTSFKTEARPWFDLDLDFDGMLIDFLCS